MKIDEVKVGDTIKIGGDWHKVSLIGHIADKTRFVLHFEDYPITLWGINVPVEVKDARKENK
jgi:hypothetical protein